MPLKYSSRDKKHVGYNVLESDGHKCHGREPDTENFAAEIIRPVREPHSQCHQPVTANPRNKSLQEGRINLMLGHIDQLIQIHSV
ncbi:hypothetical protein D3C86_1853640 [compost metagenome]